jgi:outer membrane protein insertion porin family
LNVDVTETRTGSVNFGAGFSSIDNLLGFLEYTQGNFDVAGWPRFQGAGQKFRMRAQYGTRRKDFVIALTEPYFMDRKLSLGSELYYRDASYSSRVYDERRYGGAIFMRRALSEFTSARFEYRLENTGIHNFDDGVSDLIRSEEGDRLKSQISLGLSYDARTDFLGRGYLPQRGHRVEFQTYLAGGFLGGDTDIYGIDLEAAKYFKLPGSSILSFEGQIAAVDTWSSGDRVPIYDRLYLGGPNSLRGFRYRDVGPKDEDGEAIGGSTLARFTVEYTFPIVESIRGAVFYDVGFVNSGSWDFDTGDVNSDVGLGLLLELPAIGPIRIDYGIPLSADEHNDSSGKFQFNVGYKF